MEDFSFYFGLGWHHIISPGALDHILFIIALSAVYVLKDWKQVLILVTAFTIGHSITLALSTFDIIRINERWVEFLIPCTILVTAISNITLKSHQNQSIRLNYFIALLFGFIHGMGFANTIRFVLSREQRIAPGLFAFNTGLEAGQIVVVLGILLISSVCIQILKLQKRDWVMFLSAAVFSLALKMAIERIF